MKTQAPKEINFPLEHESDEWMGGSVTVPVQVSGSLSPVLLHHSLWQGMVMFLIKEHTINTLGFIPCIFYQQYENSHRSYIMERMCTCYS